MLDWTDGLLRGPTSRIAERGEGLRCPVQKALMQMNVQLQHVVTDGVVRLRAYLRHRERLVDSAAAHVQHMTSLFRSGTFFTSRGVDQQRLEAPRFEDLE